MPESQPSLTRDPVSAARAPRGARCGVACVPFTLPEGIPMAGYSLLARRGKVGAWELSARAMVLEDDAGHVVAFVVADLMSASRYLLERAAALTRKGASGLDVHQIVLMGTHTHTAPGGFYGNSLYDSVASSLPGFRRKLTDELAQAIADAVEEAWQSARPARICLRTERLWGASRNRSLPPFLDNPQAARWNTDPALPGYREDTSQPLSPQQLAIDPRIVILSAHDAGGARIGTFATFGCHNTALGVDQKYYAPDWTGITASIVEQHPQHGAPITLVGLSGAGDISPLPPDDNPSLHAGPKMQGVDLARFVGGKVAERILAAHAKPPQLEPITLESWYEDWIPVPGSDIPGVPQSRIATWEMGAPSLAGAEDGRSPLFPRVVREGMRGGTFGPESPQAPKVPALGILGTLLRRVANLRPSPSHALHVVRVGSHAFATVPGEPTACAAFLIESAVRQLPGVRTASVLGYAGDYAGYFTTRPEYLRQHYEGASTLYGAESLNHLAARLARLARGAPFAQPGRQVLPFSLVDAEGAVDTQESAPRAADSTSGGRALSSGGHLEGRRVYAWWAWSGESGPREGFQVHLELRPSGQGTGGLRVSPRRVQLVDQPVLGQPSRVWMAEFELDVPSGGLDIVALPHPPSPFQAEPVEIGDGPSHSGTPMR
jgi:neutral ceramidase